MTRKECIDRFQEIIDANRNKIMVHVRIHVGYLIHAVKYLKEQEAVEGTIEETRGEWLDETLPVSRNKEREYPCDPSRRNKA